MGLHIGQVWLVMAVPFQTVLQVFVLWPVQIGTRNDDKQNFGLEFLSFGLLMSMILLAV